MVALGGIVNCTKEGEVPCHFPGVHQAERHASARRAVCLAVQQPEGQRHQEAEEVFSSEEVQERALQFIENQLVEKGQIIGTVGSTGKSTGAHLHWSILVNNTYIDPELLID